MKCRMVASISIAVTILVLYGFPTVSAAQSDREALGAMYSAFASIPTNIDGIRTFPAPPAGFDPTAAAEMDLARYGYPPRPGDPNAYQSWARAVKAMQHAPAPDKLVAKPYSSHPMMPGKMLAKVLGTPSTSNSYNWSGVAVTSSVKKFTNTGASFYEAIGNVSTPVAQDAFGACDGQDDIEVAWVGIDGFNNNTVLQGGTQSEVYCSGGSSTKSYCDWIEWYPSYSVMCVIFPTGPSDQVYVEAVNYGNTNTQTVCVIDETLQVGGCYTLSYIMGDPLIGKSAEWVVERPCCLSGNFPPYPLSNYVSTEFFGSLAYTYANYGKGNTPYYPGSQSPTTYLITMMNDQFSQAISTTVPGAVGGKYAVVFEDEGCAKYNGCTP